MAKSVKKKSQEKPLSDEDINIKAHREAEEDIENDPEMDMDEEPGDDLDEGELARFDGDDSKDDE